MLAERCPLCDGDYALIGRAHRCPGFKPAVANKPSVMANTAANKKSSYRNRDEAKRREYMRQYMAKKRAKDAPVEL